MIRGAGNLLGSGGGRYGREGRQARVARAHVATHIDGIQQYYLLKNEAMHSNTQAEIVN